MVQKLSPENPNPLCEQIHANWRWRRFSAFALTSSCLFLLLVFVWALKVKSYRVDNNLSFRIQNEKQDDSNHQDQYDALNKSILDAMQNASGDERLISLVGSLKTAGQITSPLLIESDLDTLRSRIKVYTRKLDGGKLAEARFSFFGSGRPDETRFLNRFAETVYAEIGTNTDYSAVDAALGQVSEHLKTHLVNQDRFTVSLRGHVARMDQQLDRIKQHLDGFGNRIKPPETLLRDEQTRADAQRELEEEVREIANLQKPLGENSSSELAGIERQIAVMRLRSARTRTQDEDDGFLEDPYFDSVSFPKGSTAAPDSAFLSELTSELQQVDTSMVYSVVDSIKQHRHDDLAIPINFIDQVKENLASSEKSGGMTPLVKPGNTQVVPVGGIPNNSQLVWISLISLAFGAAIAWKLNPGDADRGFADTDALTEALGVPVVGSFPLQSQAKTKTQPLATSIVFWCRIILPIVLVIVAAACLLNHEVWTQMIENPIRGLARVVWLFKGK